MTRPPINSRPIHQTGSVTSGHLLSWTTDGVARDAGTPADPKITGGLGLLSNNDTAWAIWNAPVSGATTVLSAGVSDTAANISLNSYGGAPDLPLDFIINGVTYTFGGFGINIVEDAITTVTAVQTLEFVSGATVTAGAPGVAQITVMGVASGVSSFNTRTGAVTLDESDIANLDLSGLPTSDPGGGKVWLNGGFLFVGAV